MRLAEIFMSYIQQYFGKQPQDLVYQDIIDFFANEKEESDKIEFKSYHSLGENDKEKENGIIRTVCALLNSNGGLIIWGAPIGQNVAGRTEKVFVGTLSPVTRQIEKDYFINRITDSITPSPNEVFFFRLEDGTNYVYVIEVGKSEYAPHQFRNIYYMRIDGQSRPAPHHYIEALFKKITYPKLKGYIKPERLYHYGTSIFLKITPVIFNLSKLLNEHNVYYRIVVTKGIFANSLKDRNSGNPYGLNGNDLRVLNALDTIYYNEPYQTD